MNWTKHESPVWSGAHWCAGDPSLLREPDGTLRMYHTSVNPDGGRCVIAQAVSGDDGQTWQYADVPVALAGAPGRWDERVEGCCIWRTDRRYLLYYGGYTDAQEAKSSGLPVSGPASLGVAVSEDGLHFERVQDEPILTPTPGMFDESSVYCPTIGALDGQLHMLYAAHAYQTRRGVWLCGATSSDGMSWTKRPDPVLAAIPELVWADGGVAEPSMRQAPDGSWILLFTSIGTGSVFYTGFATAPHPFGPWDVRPEPLPPPGGQGSWDARGHWGPDFLLEDGRIRAWWHGANQAWKIQIGYTEAAL